MVQILPPGRQKQTFGQRLGRSLGAGLESAQKMMTEKQQSEALKGYGIDPSLPPELQKVALAESLKGKRKNEEIQNLKNLRTQNQLTQPQNNETENPYMYGLSEYELMNEASEKKQSATTQDPAEGFNALDITDEMIEEANMINPAVGRGWQAAKDAAFKKQIEREKLDEKKLVRQESGIERSYNNQKEFINDTTNSYKGFETEMKPRLLQMRNIPDEDIIGPTAAVFLDAMGIPLGALENPSSELYNKLSQDLLKGLPETYGSRILKVEVDNFLKTIPTLMNSPDGRRMIASNMLKLGEMKEVYYNAMRSEQNKIEEGKQQYPRDFQQKVFDQVRPQIDRINEEFIKMSEVTSVPKGTIPFFAPDGQIKYVPKEHAQWAQEQGARRIW